MHNDIEAWASASASALPSRAVPTAILRLTSPSHLHLLLFFFVLAFFPSMLLFPLQAAHSTAAQTVPFSQLGSTTVDAHGS